uniref:Uncharacterized protein n=1 Tax=Candidatus Kentrum sp. MB TaxID=2138164 RepID=A0A450XPJ4_9GAMM|nr:MAG: hypothetical protein BECKMB1821G_GA0114241_102439 [Candidatus Kentron sp. MB]VFK31231.1 MAG: hypothetical protein BECKMB1821I_GA0114274_102138 [Candidatus Kentron sp. MB]VFK75405.1 MAG: hypothetical protein BECKMB1821H_GA0114242_102139 [Candidatus Kentron sp. MB]
MASYNIQWKPYGSISATKEPRRLLRELVARIVNATEEDA